MANFLNKIRINSAISKHTKQDLSCDHVSSADFMQFNVAYVKELVPKEHLKVGMETFTRMEPLVVPTFGRASIKNRAFFVPFRIVFPAWTDFITDTPHSLNNSVSNKVIVQNTPLFSQLNFWYWLIADNNLETGRQRVEVLDEQDYRASFYKGNIRGWRASSSDISVGDVVVDTPHSTAYDYIISWSSDFTSNQLVSWIQSKFPSWYAAGGLPIKLTWRGRQVMKILNSLGYVLNPYLSGQIANYSALQLLCLTKIYADWFMPSAYNVTDLDYLFNINQGNVFTLRPSDYDVIFRHVLRVSYDSDYFVSAWDKPNVPNGGSDLSSSVFIPNIDNLTSSGTANGVTYFNNPIIDAPFTNRDSSGTNSQGPITQFTLQALRAVTDYMKRHQIAGARSIDRYLARFGVQLSAEKLNRSIYLGQHNTPLQIGDVMSTADTEGTPLGSYAGKGIGYCDGNFDCSTDEYGMFIIISTIVPNVGYYQGVDRNVLHTTRLSFYTPEYDSLGTQAIGKNELYIPEEGYKLSDSSAEDYDNQVFGFIPRYAEYKCSRDRLTGDKRYNSMSVGQDSWHLFRMLDFENTDSVVHSIDFVRGYDNSYLFNANLPQSDISQYNRIFQNTDLNADHFNMIYHFNVVSYAPMSSMYDNYEFEDKGDKVTLDVNGVKMN